MLDNYHSNNLSLWSSLLSLWESNSHLSYRNQILSLVFLREFSGLSALIKELFLTLTDPLSHNGYDGPLQLEKARRWASWWKHWLYPPLKRRVESSYGDEGGSGWSRGAQPFSLFCHGKHRTEDFKGQTCLRKKEPHFHQNSLKLHKCVKVPASPDFKVSHVPFISEQRCARIGRDLETEKRIWIEEGVGGIWRLPEGLGLKELWITIDMT